VAIVEADTQALFGALVEVLTGFGPCRLSVRTHPNRPQGDPALARAMADMGPERAQILPPDADLYDAIGSSDALITIGSTVAFEAMALGCQPIVFESDTTYGATSLAAFEDAVYVVRDAGGLRVALAETSSGAPGARQRRAQWPTSVRNMLGDLSTPLDVQLARAITQLDHAAEAALPRRH